MADRPRLPLQVGPHYADQLALAVPDVPAAIAQWSTVGHPGWVVDDVVAKHEGPAEPFLAEPWRLSLLESKPLERFEHEFAVRLAFNYTVFPVEFELLQLQRGQTAQLAGRTVPTISHVGFHVPDLASAVLDFADAGFPRVMDWIVTVSHSSSQRRYKYAYVDTQALGFISKLILRVQ
jgi:hypothetical protein